MTHVAVLEIETLAPVGLLGTDAVEGLGHVVVPGHGVEDEELRFRAEEHVVGDPGGLHVGHCTSGERAGATFVTGHRQRIEHVAAQVQGRLVGEGVEHRGIRVGHQHHVRFLNALPPGDGRTVEHLAVFEQLFIRDLRGDADVLLLPPGVGEAQVDELHVFLSKRFQYVCGGHFRESPVIE